MEDRAHGVRVVPLSGVGPAGNGSPEEPRFSAADLDAARELAEYHRLLAAELAPQSELRGLVLRCAGHWSRLGAIPRNGLTEVKRPDRD